MSHKCQLVHVGTLHQGIAIPFGTSCLTFLCCLTLQSCLSLQFACNQTLWQVWHWRLDHVMHFDVQASPNSSSAITAVPAQYWVLVGAGPHPSRGPQHMEPQGRAAARALEEASWGGAGTALQQSPLAG